MRKLGIYNMVSMSNAKHRKTKTKTGSRITERKTFVMYKKLPTFTYTASPESN